MMRYVIGFCACLVLSSAVTAGPQQNRLTMIRQSVTNIYTADGYEQPIGRTTSVNRSNESITEYHFRSSSNTLQEILDTHGKNVLFTVTAAPNIFHFSVKLNEPVPPGDTLVLEMRDRKRKMQKGRNDVYVYSKRHIPGPEIDYDEKVILEKNLELLYRSPEPQEEYRDREGRVVMEYHRHMNAGDAFRIKVLYKIPEKVSDSDFSAAEDAVAAFGQNTYYSAIEINGVLCGYTVQSVRNIREEGREYMNLDQRTAISFAMLGQDFVQRQKFTYHIDPNTGNFFYHDSYLEQAGTTMSGVVNVHDNVLTLKTPDGSGEGILHLPEKTILPNTLYFPYLIRDFSGTGDPPVTYAIYNPRTGDVQDFSYTLKSREQREYAGILHSVLVFEEDDPLLGTRTEFVIDADTGMRLETIIQGNVHIYRSDSSVLEEVGTYNWDDVIFTKTNKLIGDIHAISYMKTDVDLTAYPHAEESDLSGRGQQFRGDVSGGHIKGIFEMTQARYDGNDAPAFPLELPKDSPVRHYLEPELLIESDDPLIVDRAVEITRNVKDAWTAVVGLADWVNKNIGGIGGGSAKMTLESGKGVCGEQSRLMTALCRAAGIPARPVWGLLYVKDYGGSFGSHGWVEVYMGNAGWIAVDQTIGEKDYINAGHIRFGALPNHNTSVDVSKIDIIDYRLSR